MTTSSANVVDTYVIIKTKFKYFPPSKHSSKFKKGLQGLLFIYKSLTG